jgi:preprotein translocase subunit SecD
MIAPLKKVILIFLLTLVAAYISLPDSFTIFGRNFNRRDPNFKIGNIEIKRKFDLVLGLDLAGGSHLVFEADTAKLDSSRRAEALQSLKGVIEKRVNLFGISEPNVQLSNFEGKDRIIVELPGINNTNDAVNIIGKTAQLVFGEVGTEQEKQAFIPTDLTGADLKSASVVFDQKTGKPSVQIEFTKDGDKKFADLTEKNVGKPLPIVLDNELVSAPVVQQKITGGSAVITGNFSLDEAKSLSIQLNAGALPIPIKLVNELTVGATLGADSVQKSIRAGFVGLFIVLLFMILNYGKLGIVADIALVVFGVLSLALYKLIPVVLTLPGIAGFLLSVGMAVDSNILIFERFKEEKIRRNYADALEISFGRAWDSIRDANIATIITSLVLMNPMNWSFLESSGPVRGFAITLLLGILISLFTGIVVSRNLLRVFIRGSERVNDKSQKIG